MYVAKYKGGYTTYSPLESCGMNTDTTEGAEWLHVISIHSRGLQQSQIPLPSCSSYLTYLTLSSISDSSSSKLYPDSDMPLFIPGFHRSDWLTVPVKTSSTAQTDEEDFTG